MLRNFFQKWLYYSLTPEDYNNSMNRELPKNYNNLWVLGMWFFVLAFIYSFLTVFPIFFGIYILPYRFGGSLGQFIFRRIIIFMSLAVALISRADYKKYQQTGIASKRKYFILLSVLFFCIIITAIHLNFWSTVHSYDDSIVLVFMVIFMTLALVPPKLNLALLLGAASLLVSVSILFKDDGIWHIDLLNLTTVVPIALTANWYVNTYKVRAVLLAMRLEEENVKLQAQSLEDALTGLKNRRDFDQRLQRYLFTYRESDRFLNLGILDIDSFKTYNDTLGHPQGDIVLKRIGEILMMPWDNKSMYAARVGGEEFAVLWFGKDKAESEKVILKLQDRLRNIGIEHPASPVSNMVTVSMGVFVIQSGEIITSDALYRLADEMLYEAKNSGKNRVIVNDGKTKKIYT